MPKNDDYPWVRAYGRAMGSYPYYVNDQVAQARADNAPQNATRRNDDGTWSTTDDIINPTMRKDMGLPPLPEVPEPETVNNFPVVNAVKLPYQHGMLRERYMVLCHRPDFDYEPWVVWHVGWKDPEWVAENGHYFTDPIKAVKGLKTRAAEWGARA